MIVYKTTNLINGKFYVGKDQKNDPSYLGSGKKFKLVVRKYGKVNFKKEVLEYCTPETIDEREKYWIAVTNATVEGYNISIGGTGGDLGSEVNTKRAVSLTGKKQSEETKQKRKESLTGREHDWGNKISTSMKGKTWTQKKPRSEEHRKKLAEANTGKKHSPETLEKMKRSKEGTSPGNRGKYFFKGKYYFYPEYIQKCKEAGQTPRTALDINYITSQRESGKLWKDIASELGYNLETIRLWYNKNK